MSHLRILVTGSTQALVGTLVQQGSQFLAVMLLAVILGPTALGQFALVHGLFVTVTTFAVWGVPQTIVRHLSADPSREGDVLSIGARLLLPLNLTLGAVLVLASPWLAQALVGERRLGVAIAMGAGFVLGQVATQVSVAVQQGRLQFGRAAVTNGANGVVFFIGTVGGAVAGGLDGALHGMSISSLGVGTVLWYSQVSSSRGPGDGTEKEIVRDVRRFAVLTTVSSGLVWPALFVAQVILETKGGLQEVGLFAAVRPWWQALLLLPTMLSRTALPLATMHFGRGELADVRRIVRSGASISMAFVMPVAALIYWRPEWVLSFYGPEFAEAEAALRVLALTGVIMSWQTVLGQTPAVVNRMGAGVLLNAMWAAALLTSTWYLSAAGAVGLALALFASYALMALGTAVVAKLLMDGQSATSICKPRWP